MINIKLDNKPVIRDNTGNNGFSNGMNITPTSQQTKSSNLIDDLTSIFGSSSVVNNPTPVNSNINDIFGSNLFSMPDTKPVVTEQPKNDIFFNFGNVILN